MEAEKRINYYSKRLEGGEIEEILMEEESDEELEEINDLIHPPENASSSSSSSEEEEEEEEGEMRFRVRRRGDSANILDFTGYPNGINRTAAPDIGGATLVSA
jgi:hypothetical protein